MRINQNVAAFNAWRNLTVTDSMMNKSLEKLASGLRVSRAADDAAGLAISEKMRSQVRGLMQASRNAQDAISLIQTAEGALVEVHSILQRMRELAVEAATDTLTATDRAKIVTEFNQIKAEIDRIAGTTTFNGVTLLEGGLGSSVGNVGTGLVPSAGIANIVSTGAAADTYTLSFVAATGVMTLTDGVDSQEITVTPPTGFDTTIVSFSAFNMDITINASLTADIAANNTFDVTAGSASVLVGANAGDTISVAVGDMRVAALSLTLAAVDTVANAVSAVTSLDSAVGTVSTQRATLGAYQTRLEHTIANLGVAAENLSAAESRIRDVDMALEMTQFTR
ncbi:MAG: flagellin, partial [Firmicutes bacterium RBG_13_65_8]